MNTPYGGTLVDLIVTPERGSEMKADSKDLASLTLDERGLCDLELLSVGGFSPLKGFMGKADYDRVVAEMRLADGTLWPLPVTCLSHPVAGVEKGKALALRDVYGNLLAFLHVEEIYADRQEREAELAYGTLDKKHPAVAHLERQPGHQAAGRLEVIRTPPHYDFVDLSALPAELRRHFESLGWSRIVAFQTRNPLHRAHEELTKRAAQQIGGGLLIHPVVGVTKPGDVDHFTRVRCYRALVDNYYKSGSVVLSLLPLAMRMAGPREVLLHAIIRRNYGCTHLSWGAITPAPATTRPASRSIRPTPPRSRWPGTKTRSAWRWSTSSRWSSFPRRTAIARSMKFPRVPRRPTSPAPRSARSTWPGPSAPRVVQPAGRAEILSETNPPRFRQGMTIWFTGLSGSGKSTIAHALIERLAEFGRNCSLLDGDEIRTHLPRAWDSARKTAIPISAALATSPA